MFLKIIIGTLQQMIVMIEIGRCVIMIYKSAVLINIVVRHIIHAEDPA